jgi:molybdate transport system substrate-binding protein
VNLLLAAAQLTIYAAASLTNVFPQIDSHARYSFGGSNMLAAQIEQGAPADVFASANTKLPAQLFAEHLCTRPVVFTRNALVIVVPKANTARIRSIVDLTKPGVKIVVAAAGVPVGDYTLKALTHLKLKTAVEKNVVSRETDVREVLSKIALGEADAGFVYATDARTVAAKVTVLQLPAHAQPVVRYAACVATNSPHRAAAQAFITALLGRAAQAKLRAAGFLAR